MSKSGFHLFDLIQVRSHGRQRGSPNPGTEKMWVGKTRGERFDGVDETWIRWAMNCEFDHPETTWVVSPPLFI